MNQSDQKDVWNLLRGHFTSAAVKLVSVAVTVKVKFHYQAGAEIWPSDWLRGIHVPLKHHFENKSYFNQP